MEIVSILGYTTVKGLFWAVAIESIKLALLIAGVKLLFALLMVIVDEIKDR